MKIFQLFKHFLDPAKKDEPKTFVTFDEFLKQKRDEARRSILVQVQAEKSLSDLHSYCSSFGEIKKMFYYKLPENNSVSKIFHKVKIEILYNNRIKRFKMILRDFQDCSGILSDFKVCVRILRDLKRFFMIFKRFCIGLRDFKDC